MQKRWHIEIIADYDDEEKYHILEQLVTECAIMFAGATTMLKDNQQVPKVIARSDDFFSPVEELAMVQARPERLLQMIADKYGFVGTAPQSPDAEVDRDLIEALEQSKAAQEETT